ncbi:hypothetical protein NRIC_30460 [Enterococcus florum]|uniref:DUF1827 domain-containing protein n=1 Tax=Enterococcus florum TaxID=2480627 RepID=A0A4P5PAM4_9ENTE|nr:DUF1827 family protein [Enterococcus florum]GCF95155.1 hypothetical protein NRIC_30460 [Enterococcus florum]
MKLIETPITSNVNLETLYPELTRHAFANQQAIRLYKLYAYDRTKIVYVDRFDTITLLLLNRQRKIRHQEVETIIHRLLKVDRKKVEVNIGYKQEILESGIRPKESYKDIILVQYKVE